MERQIEKYRWPKTISGWERLVEDFNVFGGNKAVIFVDNILDIVDGTRVNVRSKNLGLKGELFMESNGVGQIIFGRTDEMEICGRFFIVRDGEELGRSAVASFCDALDNGFYIGENALVERANEVLPVLRSLSEEGLKVVVDRGMMSLLNISEKGLDLVRRR